MNDTRYCPVSVHTPLARYQEEVAGTYSRAAQRERGEISYCGALDSLANKLEVGAANDAVSALFMIVVNEFPIYLPR